MNTIKLYLESIDSAYYTKFNAKVVSIDGNKVGQALALGTSRMG